MDNLQKVVRQILENPTALKINASEIERTTGISRSTVSRMAPEILNALRMIYCVTSSSDKGVEKAFILVKLHGNSRSQIDGFFQKVKRLNFFFEMLVVEGTNSDLLIKLIAPTPVEFKEALFKLKDCKEVARADIAHRIVDEFFESYSELQIFKPQIEG